MFLSDPPANVAGMDASTALALVLCVLVVGLLAFAAGRSLRPAAADPAAAPLATALAAVQAQLQAVEQDRAASQASLVTEVGLLRTTSEQVRRETAALATALRSPQVRGRWGETQLRRVLELGGALEHCDFVEQQTLTSVDGATSRPDVIVRLAGGRHLVIDAKVPLASFLASIETDDPTERARLRVDHARALRTHIQQLAARHYPRQVPGCPDFVVLFLPGEAFLDVALQVDPALQEMGFGSDVVLATPATLLALIRTVAHTWKEERLADSAREVSALGLELHERLSTAAGHLAKLGGSLRSSVEAYNSTLGSLESRVLPSARRLSRLVADGAAPSLAPVAALPRSAAAPELTLVSENLPPPASAGSG